jgi:hypothetical protein
LGLAPAVLPDIPVCAVFLLLFIVGAAAHMTLFKINMHKGKKFPINAMTFGFCLTRVLATNLRIAWASHPTSVKIGISAMVFIYAGIILLFIGNLFFAQRIVRAQHPHIGWSRPFSLMLPVLMVIIVGTILCLIVSVIYSFYTLNEFSLRAIHDIQMYGETLYMIVALLPIPIVLASVLGRWRFGEKPVDKFGQGSMRAKVVIVLIGAIFLGLGSGWRAITLYLPTRPSTSPQHPWYFSKTCFYVFNFTIEICVTFFWLLVRIDKRFYVPDGAKGPYSYGGGFTFAGEPGNEKVALGNRESVRHLTSPSSTYLPSNRGSEYYAGSRKSFTRDSRVSWGGKQTPKNYNIAWNLTDTFRRTGISRDEVAPGIAEDGFEYIPYSPFADDDHQLHASPVDVGVHGMEQEMGWDAKSGKWALRPISSLTTVARPVSTRSGF